MPMEDFKRIVDTLKVPVAIADAGGEILFANAAFAQVVGLDPRSVAGVALAVLFAAGDQKRIQQNVMRVGEGKAASAFADAELADAGRWVQVSFQPALDAKDKAVGVIAVLQDIGPQRETESALNLLSARLLAVAEGSPVALMIENAEGEIELANEPFCRLLGLESAPQSLTGVVIEEALAASAAIDRKALARALKKPRDPASIALRSGEGRALALERQPIMLGEAPAGAVWSTR